MKKLLLFALPLFFAFTSSEVASEISTEKCPPVYTAKFETTKGAFTIEVRRELSPYAADRLYHMIRSGYYDNTLFYRVVPGYVAQFGNTDMEVFKRWSTIRVLDEPVRHSNLKGTVSFARAGKETRGFDLFINLQDNKRLDTLTYEGVAGFPPLGRVTRGMDVVQQLYGGYGEKSADDPNLYTDRALFEQTYPNIDRIKKAWLVPNRILKR